MSDYTDVIDVTDLPALAAVARRVRETGQPVALMQDDELVAVVQPPPDELKATDIWVGYDPSRVLAALRASAGALQGTDRDELLADIRAQRGQDSHGRPAE